LNDRRHIIVTLVDITRQKETEKNLAAAKNESQMYLDMAFNMFVSLDVDGKIRLINRTGCDVLGVDECLLLGQDWFNFVPDEDKKKTKDLFLKLISGEYDGNVTTFENCIVNSRGESRVIKDERHNIVGTFSSGDDITEQRLNEKRVEEVWNKVGAELAENLVELKSSVRGPWVSHTKKRFELMQSLNLSNEGL
jgi:PAS domain S-box-containing protein